MCQKIHGCNQEVCDDLGDGFGLNFAQHFLSTNENDQIFSYTDGKLVQKGILFLKAVCFEQRIINFIKECDNISQQLGTKAMLNRKILSHELKKIHECLRIKIKDTKKNQIQHKMASKFYEMMPVTKDQQKLLPQIKITFRQSSSFILFPEIKTTDKDATTFTFKPELRKGLRPYQIKKDISFTTG